MKLDYKEISFVNNHFLAYLMAIANGSILDRQPFQLVLELLHDKSILNLFMSFEFHECFE